MKNCFYLFDRIDDNDEERIGHCEQHPDIYHLDVSCAGQISRDPHKAEKETLMRFEVVIS